MKNILLNLLTVVVFFFIPNVNFGQAPDLGTTSTFALFTAVGAFNNDGATQVIGDIGTNVGAFNGFPPGLVVGEIHVADPASSQAATDVDDAYTDLSEVNCGPVIATTLGNGQSLTPNVYCLGAASTLNGDLILDGQGDPNALFIFKIDGALSTGTFSNVIVSNSASYCNVYWQINGAVELGDSSVFRGTIVANGAITLLEAATLFGRGLSRAGAISLHNNLVTMEMHPIASVISASGATTFCAGDSVLLSGNSGGVWSNGSTEPSITVITSGDYFVTNTSGCGSVFSNQISVTVNPQPTASVISASATTFCVGDSAILSGNNGGTWSNGATSESITVTAGGDYFVTNTNGCGSVTSNHLSITVNPLPAPSTISAGGATTFCEGDSVILSGNSDGTWSDGSTTASITVNTSGDYFVTNTNNCGSVTSNHISVTVNECTSDCPAPVITSVDSICGNVSAVCWTSVPGATGYIVAWNSLPRTTWIYTPVTSPDTCLQFTNHFGNVNQLQVAAICENGDTSAYSSLITWVNYLVCTAPSGLVASNITSTSANLSWNVNPDAIKYQVVYKIGSNKTTVTLHASSLSLTNLPPSTSIKWAVKSSCKNCDVTSWGSYSPFASFTTAAAKQVAPDQQLPGALLLFPNPANVSFMVSFNAGFSTDQPYTLTVQDVVGHIVMTETGTLNEGFFSKEVSLSNGISDGIYFVIIAAGNKQFRAQLVVNKD